MLNLPPSCRIWLSSLPCDMRKGFDGLFAEAKRVCSEDPFAGHLFVFVGRNKGTVKVLWWSDGGLSLFSKRLEKGRFRVPVVQLGQTSVRMDAADLAMMLSGIDWTKARRQQLYQPLGSLTKNVVQGDRQALQNSL